MWPRDLSAFPRESPCEGAEARAEEATPSRAGRLRLWAGARSCTSGGSAGAGRASGGGSRRGLSLTTSRRRCGSSRGRSLTTSQRPAPRWRADQSKVRQKRSTGSASSALEGLAASTPSITRAANARTVRSIARDFCSIERHAVPSGAPAARLHGAGFSAGRGGLRPAGAGRGGRAIAVGHDCQLRRGHQPNRPWPSWQPVCSGPVLFVLQQLAVQPHHQRLSSHQQQELRGAACVPRTRRATAGARRRCTRLGVHCRRALKTEALGARQPAAGSCKTCRPTDPPPQRSTTRRAAPSRSPATACSCRTRFRARTPPPLPPRCWATETGAWLQATRCRRPPPLRCVPAAAEGALRLRTRLECAGRRKRGRAGGNTLQLTVSQLTSLRSAGRHHRSLLRAAHQQASLDGPGPGCERLRERAGAAHFPLLRLRGRGGDVHHRAPPPIHHRRNAVCPRLQRPACGRGAHSRRSAPSPR